MLRGKSVFNSNFFSTCAEINFPFSAAAGSPSKTSIACPRFPSVAESPQIRRSGNHRRNRARHNSACTPRLDPSNSCHSSRMTHRSPANFSRVSACVSNSDKLSGVVTSAVGKRSRCLCRADDDVSPVRNSTVHGIFKSASGARSDFTVSFASARNGVIHSTRSGSGFLGHCAWPGFSASHSSTGPPHTA